MPRRVASLILAFAAAPLAAQPASHPTVAETRAELGRYCTMLSEGENLYFGSAIVERLSRRLAAAPEDPLLATLLRSRLGRDKLRLGEFDDALRLLGEARALAVEHGLDDRLRQEITYLMAIVHLQKAEAANCVARHTAGSCILPITREAVHTVADDTRAAAELLLGHLEERPDDLQARWILNLARMLTGEFPDGVPAPLRPPPGALDPEIAFPRWQNIAPELGVDAYDNCGGGIMEDFDGDGLLDLVSSSWHPCHPMRAFRNDGRGGFEDVTAAWGLDGQLGGLNLMPGDFDNDGRVDILVLRGAWLGEDGRMRNSLLRNDLGREAKRFVDVTAAAGLAFPAYPSQAAGWADYDGDGDLDLYVGNEATATATDPLTLFGKTGNSYPSQLFRNNGDGTFTDVARAAGVTNRRFTKAVAWGDYDDDGDPDLYLSNIEANRLYRNNGDGTFTDVAEALGVEKPLDLTFPTWFFDWDNDGDLDLFVAAYSAPVRVVSASYLGFAQPPGAGGHAVLYRNDGGSFTDVSEQVGFRRPTLPMGANYGDLDNDGFPDIYLGTGVPDFDALMPNVMYLNDARNGGGYLDITFAGFGHLQKGHGVAFGDLDQDGDQDLFEQMGGAFPYDAYANVLYENPGTPGRRWITLRLVGTRANRFGVGARIEVRVREGDAVRSIHALAGTGGSFGASSLQQEIGLGPADAIEELIVVWPGSGTRQSFTEVELDRYYRVTEGAERLEPLPVTPFRLGGGARSGHAVHRSASP